MPAFALTVTPQPPRLARAHVRYLRKYLGAARPLLRARLAEMQVILTNNATMSRLHMDFMGLAGPTDVLTFPIDLDGKGRPIAGEVYVCVPYATKEAKARGVALREELLLYALHGMLHLCGYDDRTERDFAKMHAREDSILNQIGVGAVFKPAPRRGNR